MAELTPIERVKKFFNREPIDQMPFFTGMGMVLQPAIKKLEYNFTSEHEKYMKNDSTTNIFNVTDFISLLLATFLCFGLTFCLIMRYDVRYK